MGLGEGVSGCGCGLSAPKLGLSRRLSRSLESLRPRSRSRRQGQEGTVNPTVDNYTVCQSMHALHKQMDRRHSPARDTYPLDEDSQKENKLGSARGGSFGRGMLQRSSGRRRKIGPEPATSNQPVLQYIPNDQQQQTRHVETVRVRIREPSNNNNNDRNNQHPGNGGATETGDPNEAYKRRSCSVLDAKELKMLARATKALQEHVKDMTEKTKSCGCVSSKQALKENNLIYNNVPTEQLNFVLDKNTNTSYIRGKLLGKGGFARCYELIDIKTGKIYAGKIISKNQIAKKHQREKITREVELHRNLRNKHVVGFHSYFEDDDNVYIVLEICSKKSLVHVLKSRKTVTEPEVRYYTKQLVEGCRYIHNQNIIHRDLKLGNMLLNESMHVKLADFGLATRVEYEGEKKMTVCGTPNYIAPEVLQKRGHSFEADIWAIGCVMYALLVGRPPFETSTLKETYMRITANKFTVPNTVSPAARNLISKLLSNDPLARPTLDQIMDHEFMRGYCPKTLSSSTCETAPKYSQSNQRPKSYAAPVTPHEAMQKITASLSQLRAPKRAPTDPSPVRPSNYSSRTKSADDLRSPNPGSEKESRVTSTTHSSNQLDHTPGRRPTSRPSSRPSSISSSQLLDTPAAKRAASNTTLDSGHGSCRSPRSPSANSTEVKGPVPYGSAVRLYQMMTTCLEQMPQDSGPSPVHGTKPLWVTKWVDYSNKYGFGFQLSDKSVGVLFNDTTRMLLSADGKYIQYNDLSNRVFSWTIDDAPKEHKKKTTLLMYFAQYMDEHLIHGGDMLVKKEERPPLPPAIFMKKWFRTSRAIVMYLNCGTLQVNFFEDHTKVIISPDGQDYLVTFINSQRQAVNYRLLQLRHFGCTPVLQERLMYARSMLESIINVSGEAV